MKFFTPFYYLQFMLHFTSTEFNLGIKLHIGKSEKSLDS